MDLPLFPLQTVLFPGAPLPLHVFEDRYRQMFAQVLSGPRRFGVVAIMEGAEVGGPATYQPVGCVAEVREVRRYPDGRLDVLAQGSQRFKVQRVLRPSPFVVAEVATLQEVAGTAAERRAAAAGELYQEYLSVLLKVVDDLPSQVVGTGFATDGGKPVRLPGGHTVRIPTDPVGASYLFASCLCIDLEDKQRLLAAATAADRLRSINRLFRREVALLRQHRIWGPPRMTGPFSLN